MTANGGGRDTEGTVFLQVFRHRCSRGGCRRKEVLPVACGQCHGSFCIQHRHPLDHGCSREGRPLSTAG